MYRMTCDGFPLLDLRDNDLIVANPKLRLGVNTVNEGSFTIYKNHPNYDKLQLLKSVFEVSDEYGVIFRGRATGDTVDIHNGMTVDLEGVLSYFNDSVVRPFTFPDDFKDDADYQAAAATGNVVEFFLGWLIDNHNSQVQPFQRLQLGNVTVGASDNYFERSDKEHATTWETLKNCLFDSELGGFLCVRYENDGNYVDFLSGFEDTNEQKIVFGENLLDIVNEKSATEIYTAVIPLGAAIEYEVQTGVTEGEFVDFINTKKIGENLNIKSLADGDLTDDLVKSGDTVYSKSGVEKYGWIYAPTSETTWIYVEDADTLLMNAVDWLTNRSVVNHSIEVTAVDLHFTDAQIRSLRMYQNVIVYSEPHGLSDNFQISLLEIDLLNPQKTTIEVGKTTCMSLTDKTTANQNKISSTVKRIQKDVDSIRSEMIDEVNGCFSVIEQTFDSIEMTVSSATSADGRTYASIKLTVGGNAYTGQILLDGNVNVSGQLSADALYSALGNIANLTVDKLSTSQRIKKYLAKDTTDDNYILAQDEEIAFMSGVYAKGTEQATTPEGLPIYWESNPDEGTLGTDGFPYLNGVRIFTTTAVTNWPVYVYTYTELTKAKMAFEVVDGYYTPVLTFGAGDGKGGNIGTIQKSVDGMEIRYVTPEQKSIGITMSDEGYVDIDQRRTQSIQINKSAGKVTVLAEGETTAEEITYTETDNSMTFTWPDGHTATVTIS